MVIKDDNTNENDNVTIPLPIPKTNKRSAMRCEEIIEYLKRFKKESGNEYHIKRLGIFGSVAKGTANENSDIDIVVVLPKQDLFEIIGIKQSLEEVLKYPVDVVSYREKMNPFLKRRIDKEAIYV